MESENDALSLMSDIYIYTKCIYRQSPDSCENRVSSVQCKFLCVRNFCVLFVHEFVIGGEEKGSGSKEADG